MNKKASLNLMELLIMLLVFALAAALCLQAFAAADRRSEQSSALDRAVTEAQNAAEVLKNCSGDYEKAAALYGGSWDGSVWTIPCGGDSLRVTPVDSELPGLGRAELSVTAEDGCVRYTLNAAWQQEVSPRG